MLDGFNATCYGLTISQYQANNMEEKLLCKLHNTVAHHLCVWLGSQLQKNTVNAYGKLKSVV
jgi:hypothetical protein